MGRFVTYTGTLVVVAALGVAHANAIGQYDVVLLSSRTAWSAAYVAGLIFAAYGLGLPDLVQGWAALGRAVGATAAAAGAISLAQLVAGSALLPRFVVFLSAACLVPWYVICSAAVAGRRDVHADRARVLAVVSPDEGVALEAELATRPERPALLVRVLSPDQARSDGSGQIPLVDAATDAGASLVVLDRQAQDEESVVAQAARLHEQGVRIRTLTMFYDEWLGKLPIWELERVALMFDIGALHRTTYSRFTRLLDVALASAGTVALLLVIPLVVVGDLVANRGPLLYRQPRVGRNGEIFEILKFRTMEPDASGLRAGEWTGQDDPRVTPFGRLLRRTHLDELPQVVNILRGDLAVVGPRPEQPHYVEELNEKLPYYDLRHLARPGLTGWAQVKYGYAGSESDALQKLQYEFYYLRHQGTVLDLRILGRTLRSVLGRQGR